MARSKLRTVAGAGSIAAFLLVGGAAIPVVSADPGHTRDGNGSHRGGDSRRDAGTGRNGQDRGERGRDDRGGWQRGGGSIGPDRTTGPDRRNDPSDRNPADGSDRTAELDPNRTGTTARSDEVVTDSSSASRRSVTTATAVPEAPTPLPVVPARRGAGGGGGGGGSGAAAVTDPGASAFTAPPVTIGNGRSPGILTGPHEGAPSRAAPDVAGPAVTPPAVTPQLPPSDRLDVAPPQRTVAALWAAAAPGRPDGVLFGLAGLILAPIAGAWLGYRQARASRAAAKLVPR
jgi:hypothetical protein